MQEKGGNEAALAHCRASVALSMLLLLKDYLKKAYSLSTERVASFGPSGAPLPAHVVGYVFGQGQFD